MRRPRAALYVYYLSSMERATSCLPSMLIQPVHLYQIEAKYSDKPNGKQTPAPFSPFARVEKATTGLRQRGKPQKYPTPRPELQLVMVPITLWRDKRGGDI